MKISQSRRGLLLATIAGACLFPNISKGTNIIVGSGLDVSYFTLESPNLGIRNYEVNYAYNATSPQDGYFLLAQIILADPTISARLINYGSGKAPNYIVDSITYGGVTETNETIDPYVPYWAHWASGGNAGFPTAAPIPSDSWTLGSGISSPYRLISPGSRDALFFSDGISTPSVSVIPETSSIMLVILGSVVSFKRRRKTEPSAPALSLSLETRALQPWHF